MFHPSGEVIPVERGNWAMANLALRPGAILTSWVTGPSTRSWHRCSITARRTLDEMSVEPTLSAIPDSLGEAAAAIQMEPCKSCAGRPNDLVQRARRFRVKS